MALDPVPPARQCSLTGCPDRHLAKGFCRKHYQRWKKHGSPEVVAWEYGGDFADRMSRWVPVRSKGCWEWTGLVDNKGYGETRINSQKISAHRASYEFHIGPIPDGLWILHCCTNPPCVRPDHLYAGTPAENAQDRVAHGNGAHRDKGGRFTSSG